MSTGLDCSIFETEKGFFFEIEDPASNSLDPDYFTYGPFSTVEVLAREFNKHPNPGGYSIDLRTMDYDEFEKEFDAALNRRL
jgi:hypothetical protein